MIKSISPSLLATAFILVPTASHAVGEWTNGDAYYEGDLRATGYGRFFNDHGRMANDTNWRSDSSNGAYVSADIYYFQTQPRDAQGQTYPDKWERDAYSDVDTGTSAPYEWTHSIPSRNLDPQWSKVRAQIEVCEQTPWCNPDDCSPQSLIGFDY